MKLLITKHILLSLFFSFSVFATQPPQEFAECYQLNSEDVDENFRASANYLLVKPVAKNCFDTSFGADNKFNFGTCECLSGAPVSKKERAEVLSKLYAKMQKQKIEDHVKNSRFEKFENRLFPVVLYNEMLPNSCESLKEKTKFCSEAQVDKLAKDFSFSKEQVAKFKDVFTGRSFKKLSKHQDISSNKNLRFKDHQAAFHFAKTILVRDFLKYSKVNKDKDKEEMIAGYSERAHQHIEKIGKVGHSVSLFKYLSADERVAAQVHRESLDLADQGTKLMQALSKELVLFKEESFLKAMTSKGDDESSLIANHDIYLHKVLEDENSLSDLDGACKDFQSMIKSSCANTSDLIVATPQMNSLLSVVNSKEEMDMKTATILCYNANAFAKKRGKKKLDQETFDDVFNSNIAHTIRVELSQNTAGENLMPSSNATVHHVGTGAGENIATVADNSDNANFSGNSTFVGVQSGRNYSIGQISEKLFANIDTSGLESSSSDSGGFFSNGLFESSKENTAFFDGLGEGLAKVGDATKAVPNTFNGAKTFDKYLTNKKAKKPTNKKGLAPKEDLISQEDVAYNSKIEELSALEKRTEELLNKLEKKVSLEANDEEKEEDDSLSAKEEELAELRKMIAELKAESSALISKTAPAKITKAKRAPASFSNSSEGFSVSTGNKSNSKGLRDPASTPSATNASNSNSSVAAAPTQSASSSNDNNSGSSKSSTKESVSFQLTGTSSGSFQTVSSEAFSSMTKDDFKKYYELNGDIPLVVKEFITNSNGIEEEVSVLYEPVLSNGVVSYKKVQAQKDEIQGPKRVIASIEEAPKKGDERVDRAIKKHKKLIALMQSKLFN